MNTSDYYQLQSRIVRTNTSSGIPGDDESKRPSRAQQQSLNAECILSKEQLYDMFQQILGVKKFEHQLLFNALLVSIFTDTFIKCILFIQV